MESRKIEYIKKVAEYEGILKAAEELFITPSALSKYISKIEDALRVPLFDRVGKKFVLTYAGERYLDWLRQIETLHEEMENELQDIANNSSGRIRLGVQLSGVGYFVDQVFPRFYAKYPGVRIELYEETSNNLRKMLEDNLLDLAIFPGEGNTDNLRTIFLAVNHRVLVLPKACPLVQKAINKEGFPYPWIDFSLLKDAQFIAPFKSQDAYNIFNKIPGLYGFTPTVICQTKNFGTMIQCVEKGIGVTISIDQIVKANHMDKEVTLLSFGETLSKNLNLYMYYHKNHYLDGASWELIHLFEEAYGLKEE